MLVSRAFDDSVRAGAGLTDNLLEYVLPSVAKAHGMPMWISDPMSFANKAVNNWYPTFGGFEPRGADPYYQQWHNDSSICRPGPTIMHAVKAWKKDKAFRA